MFVAASSSVPNVVPVGSACTLHASQYGLPRLGCSRAPPFLSPRARNLPGSGLLLPWGQTCGSGGPASTAGSGTYGYSLQVAADTQVVCGTTTPSQQADPQRARCALAGCVNACRAACA